MKLNKLALIALALGLTFTSCSNDDDATEVVIPLGDYESGIIISEEGNFSNGNGAITFVSNDLETVENNVYNNVNNAVLGNLVQSMAFNGETAYIIENGSNAIKVVNRNTFEAIATLSTGFSNPRYMTVVNGKGYITNWGDGSDTTDDFIAVLNLDTNTLEDSISVEFGPEAIVSVDNTMYVAHQGAFGQNNKVSVINAITNTVSTTITVGDVPNSLQVDSSNNLWVLCAGKPSWTGDETNGVIYKINTSNNTVATSLNFGPTSHPSNLYEEDNNLYYALSGEVYKMSTSAGNLPSTSEFTVSNLYDFSVRDNQLFALDHNSYSSESSFLKVYDLDTNTEIKSIDLGPFGGEVYFN